MNSATIKLFLPLGDAKSLRIRQLLPVLGSDILAIARPALVEKDGFYVFTKDADFSSPSAAAAVIHGGSANGLTAWKTKDGKSLKQLDEQL